MILDRINKWTKSGEAQPDFIRFIWFIQSKGRRSNFDEVLLHFQVVDDEVLSLGVFLP